MRTPRPTARTGDLRPWSLLVDPRTPRAWKRVRVAGLQPAEMRRPPIWCPSSVPRWASPLLTLSFQHASPAGAGCAGSADRRPGLDRPDPDETHGGGYQVHFIVGFQGGASGPMCRSTSAAGAAGCHRVFGYPDEQGTEAATFPDHVDAESETDLRGKPSLQAEDVMSARAANRIGESGVCREAGSQFQGPEDGSTRSWVWHDLSPSPGSWHPRALI